MINVVVPAIGRDLAADVAAPQWVLTGYLVTVAALLLLRLRAKQIKPGSSWSAFTLKQELAWEWGPRQLHRTVDQEVRKEIRRQRTIEPPPLRLAA